MALSIVMHLGQMEKYLEWPDLFLMKKYKKRRPIEMKKTLSGIWIDEKSN
jgi:hypothetical protein